MPAKERVESPIGNLVYTIVTGQGKENYEGDGYEYQTCVDVDEKNADVLIDQIEDFLDANAPKDGKQSGSPYKTIDDDDTIAEGKVRFTFKTKTEFTDRKGNIKDTIVDILDSRGNKTKLPEGVLIGNDSTGKAIGQLVLWERGSRKNVEYGASLYLNKVMIKDFVEYKGEDVAPIEGGSFTGFENRPQPVNDADEDQAGENTSRRRRRNRSRD